MEYIDQLKIKGILYTLKDPTVAAQINARIEELIGTAPSNLDTLQELAAAILNDDEALEGIITTLASKTSKEYVDNLFETIQLTPGPQGETGAKGDKGDTGEQGPKGDTGATGATGKSAYEVAVDNGFSGNEAAWLASLVGPQGSTGETGSQGEQGIQGPKGDTGADGKSAYELYKDSVVESNAIYSFTSWSLDGNTAYGEGTVEVIEQRLGGATVKVLTNTDFGSNPTNFVGMEFDVQQPLNEGDLIQLYIGDEPQSIAVRATLQTPAVVAMTQQEWLASLKGADGAQGVKGDTGAQGILGVAGQDGKSAYQLAVENGFEGNVSEWLASLKGETGTFDSSDLENYATKQEIPTKVSDLNNDAGYLTQHQSLDDYATKSEVNAKIGNLGNAQEASGNQEAVPHTVKSYVDKKISDVVGAAPSTLDTLEEIAEALNDNAKMSDIASAISTKANASDIPTKVSDLLNDSNFMSSSQVEARLGNLGTAAPTYSFESYSSNGATKYGNGIVQATGEIDTDVLEVEVLENNPLDPNAADFVGLKFWISDQAEIGDTLYQLLDAQGQEVGIAVKIISINNRNLTVKEALNELDGRKASAIDVYTKAQADNKFLTQHQDISGKADLSLIGSLGNKVEAAAAVYYTEAEANTYNSSLEGALVAGEPLTQEQAGAYNAAITGATKEENDELSEAEANLYNTTLTGAISTSDIKTPAVTAVPYTNVGEVLSDIKTQLGGISIVKITQSLYTALQNKDANTLYVVIDD